MGVNHTNSYDTEINCYNKKSVNKANYCNFYKDTFNFRKYEIISSSQQTEITNNIIETNTQTTHHIAETYSNSNEISIVILNATPSTNGNYLWIPEGTTDNEVPGLVSILTYIQSKHATLTALQHIITNMEIL